MSTAPMPAAIRGPDFAGLRAIVPGRAAGSVTGTAVAVDGGMAGLRLRAAPA